MVCKVHRNDSKQAVKMGNKIRKTQKTKDKTVSKNYKATREKILERHPKKNRKTYGRR